MHFLSSALNGWGTGFLGGLSMIATVVAVYQKIEDPYATALVRRLSATNVSLKSCHTPDKTGIPFEGA